MKISWEEFFRRLQYLRVGGKGPLLDSSGHIVYGVPKGGMIAAGFLRSAATTHDFTKANVILDDILDSGQTRAHYAEVAPGKLFVTLWDKRLEGITEFVEFPWETDHPSGPDSIEQNVVRQLQYIGEDPSRPGLRDTPKRVARAWQELFAGYTIDIESLFKIFDEDTDEIVVLRNIRLMSFCEHHLLPFTGDASVGYLPRAGRVLGLSKIARVVNAFARRLQVQERLTKEIAHAIDDHLQPQGVGVIIRAHHSCMGLRGVTDGGSEMVTSCMLGLFRENPSVKAEFIELVGRPSLR